MKRPNPDSEKEMTPGWKDSSPCGASSSRPAEEAEKKCRMEEARPRTFTGEEPFSVEENSIGVKLVLIPAGRFMMGDEDAGPVHEVELTRDFRLGRTPVTQAQWVAVMGAGANSSRFQGTDRPVECVSWDDAREFIQRLNAREGTTKYRLPTEAEWEYACRSGGGGEYCFGDRESDLKDYAWYDDNSGDETHPVGLKKPNAWGLHDMHGNVLEWCEDRYGDYLPGFARDPKGPSSGWRRVMRGGSWCYVAKICRSANRSSRDPEYRYGNRGFRLARSL